MGLFRDTITTASIAATILSSSGIVDGQSNQCTSDPVDRISFQSSSIISEGIRVDECAKLKFSDADLLLASSNFTNFRTTLIEKNLINIDTSIPLVINAREDNGVEYLIFDGEDSPQPVLNLSTKVLLDLSSTDLYKRISAEKRIAEELFHTFYSRKFSRLDSHLNIIQFGLNGYFEEHFAQIFIYNMMIEYYKDSPEMLAVLKVPNEIGLDSYVSRNWYYYETTSNGTKAYISSPLDEYQAGYQAAVGLGYIGSERILEMISHFEEKIIEHESNNMIFVPNNKASSQTSLSYFYSLFDYDLPTIIRQGTTKIFNSHSQSDTGSDFVLTITTVQRK